MTNLTDYRRIIKEKVEGVWQASHDTTGHRYIHKDGMIAKRSVTSIISGVVAKPHLIKWAVKVGVEWLLREDRVNRLHDSFSRDELINGAQMAHLDTRDDAGAVGTVAHDMAERYINEWIATGERPTDIRAFAPNNYDPRSIASARAIEAWFTKCKVEPIASELLVGNQKYSAGTLDFLCLLDGKLTLIDFKTSNGVDEISYSMQVAAYKFFFEEMTGLKIHKCKILHLSKDYDKFTVYDVKKPAQAYKAFKNICAMYDWMYGPQIKLSKDIKKLTI